jgi:hypothetical protein
MRKLSLALLALVLTTSVASADRGRRGDRDNRRGHDRDRGRDRGSVVVRVDNDRHHRDRRPARRVVHRPVHIRNGSFHFHGGVVRRWRAPVITQRYYDYRVQPAPIVENYDAMPGYVWHPGQWQWSGREWSWMPGHYDVAPDHGQQYGYDQGYDQGYAPAYAPPSGYAPY